MKKTTLLFALLLIFLSKSNAVDLKWVGNKPQFTTGTSWGVPFLKGQIQKTQSFVLQSDSNKNIPVQSWPLAYWPDGSVKWMGFAATVNPEAKFRLTPSSKANPRGGLIIQKTATTLQISNATMSCTIANRGEALIKELRINNNVVAQNGRLTCTIENREQCDNGILSYSNYRSEIKEAVVEQSGAVRAVVKISGTHIALKGNRELLPFVVRLYFYYGTNNIRMLHTFTYDGDQNKDFIKGLGVVFDVPFREQLHNRHVRFSGENDGLWNESVKPLIGRRVFDPQGDDQVSSKQFDGIRIPDVTPKDGHDYIHYKNFPEWNTYQLDQLGSDGFSIRKRTNDASSWLFAASGRRSSGFALIGDVSGGLAVSLKNFWQSYPASLEIDNARKDVAQLKVWFWAKNAEAMDLRHYDTIPHGLETTYEDVQPGMSTPYGVSRTSELTLFPFDQLPSKQVTAAMAQYGTTTHQLICTPEYLHSAKAFGIWSLPDRSTKSKLWIENQLDSSITFYKRAIDEHNWYGFWNYGDVMHSYDGIRHEWRYDIGGFAWDNTELAPSNWLWYSFLRSGNPDIFNMAEAMTRHNSEVDVYHLGEMKGLGSRHNVSHWGCGAKEARIGQAAWKRHYYYLTTDERLGDLMHETLEAETAACTFDPLRVAMPLEKYPVSAPYRLRWGPDWIALAGNWMTEWERTGDKTYYQKIVTGLDCLSKLPGGLFTGPNPLGYDPKTGKLTYEGNPKTVNRNHLATIMGGYEIILEMMDMIDHPAFKKTWTDYCKFYSMPKNDPLRSPENAFMGNIEFKTPRLTAYAAKELNDPQMAKRAWSELLGKNPLLGAKGLYYSNIIHSPEVLYTIHENPQISTNSTAQWGLNAIILLELIGNELRDSSMEANTNQYNAIEKLNWKEVFSDKLNKSWTKNWFLDGQKATLQNTNSGLTFSAGANGKVDADHAVLWTKQSFEGDLRIEFDFTRKDTVTKFVNIIYLFAQGSGAGDYAADLDKWSNLRTIPAMKCYFEHTNAYHISFAAFENDNLDPTADYIRARRYLPERGKGLNGTEMKPEYLNTGLFKTDIPHHISIIRKGDNLFMKITNADKELICKWNTNDFPPLQSGRIGLRLMGSRSSEFSNFNVMELKP